MSLLLKNLLFTVVVPGTVAVYLPLRIAGGWSALVGTAWGWRQSIAMVPLLFGTVVYVGCVWGFGKVGRGTPAPIDEPRRLVIVGLYRYVRNPMYVGVLSIVLGWTIFFRSWRLLLYGGCLALGFHLFVVLYEEPHLARRFGESYDHYRRLVHRWRPGRRYEPAA
ncbi:MAG TPA: isoprenylcysteine carboxylmethyltransferase family protein [Candidatus Polarisedimenticolia bacterium]|nr:isoprenylcysteine carboxylmethyltransferase family protein [Candidatus Polarisedimenticolia bacterium]